MSAGAPIGVFDSGLGGLTVAKEILRVLPHESLAYLGDTARVPYGIRSPETVMRYAREGTRFLMSKGVKLLVIACNTVSAVGLDAVREVSSVPVVGVIEPGARAAASRTHTRKVGVIGTEATVRSAAYQRAIHDIAPEVQVHSSPCPLFVPLVEEGWLEGEVTELVAARYLKDMNERDIDALVLGCTHYPLLAPVIAKALRPGIALINSATETAASVQAELLRMGLLASPDALASHKFYVTDSPEKFRHVGERFLGTSIDDITKVALERYE